MKKLSLASCLIFSCLCSSSLLAADKGFFNTTTHTLEIQISKLECMDSPEHFTHCQLPASSASIVLKPNSSAQVKFDGQLLGKLIVKNYDTGETMNQEDFLDKNGNPIFDEFNYCSKIIVQSMDYNSLTYQFAGCTTSSQAH